MKRIFHSRLFSLFTVLVLDHSPFTSQDKIRVKNYKNADSVVTMNNANNMGTIKEARKGFSLHALAQSTPRCTRQLNESKLTGS